MYCPEKLKLNKFKQVNIPSKKEYFSRYGAISSPSQSYTGEEGSPVQTGLNKTEQLEATSRYLEAQARNLELSKQHPDEHKDA